ncbi:pantetheine-phosphate adenylyltransferase [uncultured Anaerococcus sp.]|uniref:pantetheine-phosphate adenylyltransferase n=1 Tax=uncultured Anaerococcus sp. TaxID=293428 RepID=UPI0025D08B7B|nr:pantetheine-phosphate adenylyltransferase [uncultured Anaerococcus sp.]
MRVIYPGSFDPLTKGHMDIISRLSIMYEEVVVAILYNENKNSVFTVEERKDMINEAIKGKGLKNISIEAFDGLLADFAKDKKIKIVARGLRAVTDYEYEKNIARVNATLYEGLETIFLLSNPAYSFTSSSGVREIAAFKGDVSAFVSQSVEEKIKKKFNY